MLHLTFFDPSRTVCTIEALGLAWLTGVFSTPPVPFAHVHFLSSCGHFSSFLRFYYPSAAVGPFLASWLELCGPFGLQFLLPLLVSLLTLLFVALCVLDLFPLEPMYTVSFLLY